MSRILTLVSVICLTLVFSLILTKWTRLRSASHETTVLTSLDPKVQRGFGLKDFAKPQLKMVIFWKEQARFPNQSAYWKVLSTECNSGQFCAALVISHPKTLADTEIPGGDRSETQADIMSSPWINVVNPRVLHVAQWLRKHKIDESLGKVRQILRIIPQMVWVANDVEIQPLRSTDEIIGMAAGKKVYGTATEIANVFVALCRGAGVPARIILGYKLTPLGHVSHVWAEAKINGHWIPIDPQKISGVIGPNYIPTGILNESDLANNYPAEDVLIAVKRH